MANKDFVKKMVIVPKHGFTREHVAYVMAVTNGLTYFIDWNGNRESIKEDMLELREATIQEIADEAKKDCELNADEYSFE